MAKLDDPKSPELDEPPLPLHRGGPGARKSFFRQLSLLHIMISLVYFALLFTVFRQIMLSNGYAERILFGVLLGLGFCLVGLWAAARLPRFAFIGWAVFVFGYMTITGVTTTFFAIPALPILIGAIIFLGLRRRSNNQDALVWVLAVAAERKMPLAPGVMAFSSQVSGIFHVWAGALADMLYQGIPLPDALDSIPRIAPRRSTILIRMGWESGDLALGLKESVAARETSQPVLHAIAGRMAYLGWVTSVGMFIVAFVIYFIIPKFEAIFKDFGVELPAVTKAVILGSHYAADFSYLFIAASLLVMIYGMYAVLGPGDVAFPLFDRFFYRRHATLILRSLAIVVSAGRPIPPALFSLAQWYPAGWVRKKLAVAAADASLGVGWIESLRENGLITPSDAGVLGSAQRAGNLAWALRELAETGDRRRAYRLQAWTQVFFVLTMIVLGAVVFLLAVGFFMPLITLIERLAS